MKMYAAPANDGAWGIQGERHRTRERAQAPLVASLLTFLAKQESKAPGRGLENCSSQERTLPPTSLALGHLPLTREALYRSLQVQ